MRESQGNHPSVEPGKPHGIEAWESEVDQLASTNNLYLYITSDDKKQGLAALCYSRSRDYDEANFVRQSRVVDIVAAINDYAAHEPEKFQAAQEIADRKYVNTGQNTPEESQVQNEAFKALLKDMLPYLLRHDVNPLDTTT